MRSRKIFKKCVIVSDTFIVAAVVMPVVRDVLVVVTTRGVVLIAIFVEVFLEVLTVVVAVVVIVVVVVVVGACVYGKFGEPGVVYSNVKKYVLFIL